MTQFEIGKMPGIFARINRAAYEAKQNCLFDFDKSSVLLGQKEFDELRGACSVMAQTEFWRHVYRSGAQNCIEYRGMKVLLAPALESGIFIGVEQRL